jgi:predicted DNA-binding protein with PD1-like motif
MTSAPTRTFPLRLRPGQDLRECLERLARVRGVRAGIVLSAVGSLEDPNIRFAGAERAVTLGGCFEIVSLAGTVCREGAHLHIAVADADGRVLGGHVAFGCRIYTTAELVISELAAVAFARRFDAQTGYRELTITRRWRPLRSRRIALKPVPMRP